MSARGTRAGRGAAKYRRGLQRRALPFAVAVLAATSVVTGCGRQTVAAAHGALSGGPSSSGRGTLGPAKVSPVEGLPVPADARLTRKLVTGRARLAVYALPATSVQGAVQWFAARLPRGVAWHSWQPCVPPPPGATLPPPVPGAVFSRDWERGTGQLSVYLADNGGKLSVMLAVAYQFPLVPPGVTMCSMG